MLSVEGAGTYDFTGTGALLSFPAGGSLYPGEIVVTRLENLPSVLPNSNPNVGCYWILQGYGSDHFTALSDIRLTPFSGEPSDTILSAPAHAGLYLRRPGAAINSWENLCGATSVTAGTTGFFRYGSDCMVGTSGQMFLASDEQGIPLLKGTTSGLDTPANSLNLPVRLYPNPVTAGTDIRVEYPLNQNVRIKIYSLEGKLIRDLILENSCSINIKTNDLIPGSYLMRIHGDRFIQSERMVVVQ